MNLRTLGQSELRVAPLCLGGNVFGWTITAEESFKVLDAFVDGGGNFIDTADVYSRWAPGNTGGESEAILGEWFKKTGKRSKVILATKLGKEMGPGKTGLSAKYMVQAVEASLARLQTDYIDLYQSHADDPSTPLEETLEAFGKLIQQGKVRAIGASNYSGARLAEALEVSRKTGFARYESLQPEYNLASRKEYESDQEPVVLREKVGVIPYYSLASGFLTGKYRSEADLGKSARGQGVRKYLNERGFKILQALDELAAEYNSTPGVVALAWLIARPSITAPIASATSIEQVKDLLAATELSLSPAAVELLNQSSE